MKEYRTQLQINNYDPICAASTIGDTVIGILFEKQGSEIKTAIGSRLKLVDEKVKNYQSVVSKIEVFIEEKRKVLKDLDIIAQDRSDEKSALVRPYQKKIDDIRKKIQDVAYDHDKETHKKIREQAVVFEKGFDDFKPQFDELDEFLRKERERVETIQSGSQGVTGIQGATGMHGIKGIEGTRGEVYEPVRGCGFGDPVTAPSTKPEDIFTEEESRALSRIWTLRSLLQKYVGKIETLKNAIKSLLEEKRRLSLISRNLDNTRSYKLDLNKLSAFGFEDIEVL
jgi:hypothetical protein